MEHGSTIAALQSMAESVGFIAEGVRDTSMPAHRFEPHSHLPARLRGAAPLSLWSEKDGDVCESIFILCRGLMVRLMLHGWYPVAARVSTMSFTRWRSFSGSASDFTSVRKMIRDRNVDLSQKYAKCDRSP
jgi:hypothetical protein